MDSLNLRLAVVSPFIDKRHGTERCIAEQLERFATQAGAEIHLYSQRVEDLATLVKYPSPVSGTGILWHRVSSIRGPHLASYLWWFAANHVQRWWDSKVRGVKFDLLYSPGVNALDADAISIHVVFREFYRRVRPRLRFRGAPISRWPVILHRRLYYRLISFLERVVYARPKAALAAISQHSAGCMAEFFGRRDVRVIRYGVDTKIFHPSVRETRRQVARSAFRLGPADFCLLLIGNDWNSKGLDILLAAMARCGELPLTLCVVGSDDRRPYAHLLHALHLEGRVRFLDPSPEVVEFYAAADAYVGPSLEDAYGLPILEAMACGLPVIASSRAGVSEILRDGQNGLVLRDPEDAPELAALLRRLYSEPALRNSLGEAAVLSAAQETWDRNAAAMWEFLSATLADKLR